MAKVIKKKKSITQFFPLEAINFTIIGVGLLMIIIAYYLLSQSDVRGDMPLNIVPVVLVLGYCVVIPFGILYKSKNKIK